MKKLSDIKLLISIFFLWALLISCKKGWLDAKPDKSLVVPKTIQDYQALLDNTANQFNRNAPGLQELSADDYYLTYTDWQSKQQIERNAYTWAQDIFQGSACVDWNNAYSRIFNTNVVLEGIEKIIPDPSSAATWNNVKGEALFFRGFDFFNLAQLFCKPYSGSTANADLGIPLRLNSNINETSVRTSVQLTYDQIIKDLMTARKLLPNILPSASSSITMIRPSLISAYALLARVYLSMGDYTQALLFSDSCLQQYNIILDYNNTTYVNPSNSRPIQRFNPEVLFHCTTLLYGIISSGIIDSSLYNSYNSDDIRKTAFYTNTKLYKGSYDNSAAPFCGLTTGEMYLIRAECNARAGNTSSAISDLNALVRKRWRNTVTYPMITAANASEAVVKVLVERRKELVFRGLRWTDLRRLNLDSRFANNITHGLLNAPSTTSFTLLPNDIKYVLPIPDREIIISGMPQNPR